MQETLVGCLIGAAITWLVSYAYYKRAGDDLKWEARKLEHQTQLILPALEQGGMVELTRAGGTLVGFQKWIVPPKGFNATSFGTPSVVVGSNSSSQPTAYGGG